MDQRFDLNSKTSSKNKDKKQHYSYLDSSTLTEDNNNINNYNNQKIQLQKIHTLENKLRKINSENEELKKLNKVLYTKIDFLINNNTIVKNVKNEMNDCSQISHCNNNQDSLKEFFFLLVICEKMNYIEQDRVWNADSNSLYMNALKNDLSFYEWPGYIKEKIAEQFSNSYEKIVIKPCKESGCLDKLK